MKTNGQRIRLGGAIGWTTIANAPAVSARASEPDQELGERLFTEKGCVACHTVGEGRLVGPDLQNLNVRPDEARWAAR
jgi:cytochrome c2